MLMRPSYWFDSRKLASWPRSIMYVVFPHTQFFWRFLAIQFSSVEYVLLNRGFHIATLKALFLNSALLPFFCQVSQFTPSVDKDWPCYLSYLTSWCWQPRSTKWTNTSPSRSAGMGCLTCQSCSQYFASSYSILGLCDWSDLGINHASCWVFVPSIWSILETLVELSSLFFSCVIKVTVPISFMRMVSTQKFRTIPGLNRWCQVPSLPYI